jgi:hypothetical protein
MMNPWRSGFYAMQLISHKVMRYAVPFFLIAILAVSIVLATHSFIFALVLSAQILFYLSGLAAWLLERAGIKSRTLALPEYFVLSNLASLIACLQFLRGERYAHWEPIRERASLSQRAPAITPYKVR